MGDPLPVAATAPRMQQAIEIESAIGKSFIEAVTAAADAALCDSPHCLNPKLLRDSRIKTLLGDLSGVDKIPAELARVYSHSLCVAALAFIAGNRLMARICADRRPIAPLPKWRLARVNQYIDAHMEEAIRLADLAKAAGLTKMHFAAQFRASVGMCPHEYLLRQRIRRAQALLQDSGQRLVDVALSVGFQAQSHFTTVFRRYVGDSPHRWRLSRGINDEANMRDLSHGESALC
jgi:AraC-like DNA-binding protein